MPQAHFIFTQYTNSFKVEVPNLESLSVVQIQSIENFVSLRKGVFDFVSYSFSIPKKLEFHNFVELLKHLKLDVICEEKPLVKSENSPRISFGQYKGMLYCELSNAYLLWLKSNYRGFERKVLDFELLKRGLEK